jgi:phosphatidylglycerophosphatase A
MTNRLALLLATWFGSGYWPKAPGTAGSLGGLLVAWVLMRLFNAQPWHFLLLTLLVTPAGIWASTRAARLAAGKDPQFVVVDEVLGQWLTLAGARVLDLPHMAAAFVLFRLLDIVKPWPLRRLERLPEGTGIVADDLAAGAYGALVLLLAGWFNL